MSGYGFLAESSILPKKQVKIELKDGNKSLNNLANILNKRKLGELP